MLGEALVTSIAEKAVSAVWGKVSQGRPSSLKAKLTQAMQVALVVAVAKTFEQYPEQDEELFLENFLRHEGAPILAQVLTPDTPPTGEALARAWSNRFDEKERDILASQMTPLCTTFLDQLRIVLFRTRLLQEDSLVRDLLTLDATDTLIVSLATAADRAAGMEANTLAMQQELAALREEIQHASQSLDKALAAWLDTGTVLNHLLEAQLQGVKRFNYTYASRVRRFLREYLGSGRDAPDADERVPFGGRDAELEKLTTWLDSGREKYLLLVAKAGRGKSALLARWLNLLQQRDNDTPIFVPISIRFETAAASISLAILASRLAELHGETLKDVPSNAEQWKEVCHSYLTRPIPNGRRLVIIMDGLDEAEQGMATASLLPHPDDLASGIRIVLSARLQLGDTSPANWMIRLELPPRQVKAFTLLRLTRAGLEDVLMKWGNPLWNLPHNHADLVKELLRITEGDPLLVNLYVKELLELGQGVTKLTPSQLSKTPKGLGGFFEVWRRSIEQAWSGNDKAHLLSQTHLAVRSLLAGARGPIYVEDLTELTDPETGGVGDVLRHAMLPLNRFLVGDGKTQGFVFSHPRFADYIWEEELTAKERDHWSARFVAHGTLVLQALRATPPQKHSKDAESFRYAVQYYREHLDLTDAPVESFYDLLCHEWAESWFALRGTYEGFLADVERTWIRTKIDPDNVRGMIMEVWCGLCQSSVVSISTNLSPKFIIGALETGFFGSTQVLALLRQNSNEQRKTQTIVNLLKSQKIRVDDNTFHPQILEIVRTMSDDDNRTEVLLAVAPHLPLEVLDIARTMSDNLFGRSNRTKVLLAVAPYLPDPQPLYQELLNIARTMSDNLFGRIKQTEVLLAVAPHLPLGVLDIARTMSDDNNRTEVLLAVAPYLPDPQPLYQELLNIARTMSDDDNRTEVLLAVAPYLPDPQPLYQEVLNIARTMSDDDNRTEVLLAVAPYLPLEVLDIARTMSDTDILRKVILTLIQSLKVHPKDQTHLKILWSTILENMATRPRYLFLADLATLMPFSVALVGIFRPPSTPTPIILTHIRRVQLLTLLHEFDLGTYRQRTQLLDTLGIPAALRNELHFDTPQAIFTADLVALLERIPPSPEGDSYLVRFMRYLHDEAWVGQAEPRSLVAELLGNAPPASAQQRLAHGTLEAVQTVCRWWP